jgi:hypothetical protein
MKQHMPKTKKKPDTGDNSNIALIRIVMHDGREFDFPANHYTKFSQHRGMMQINDAMFAHHAPNGRNVLFIVSTTDDEMLDEIMRASNDVIEKMINT